jgi:hypothetical protein
MVGHRDHGRYVVRCVFQAAVARLLTRQSNDLADLLRAEAWHRAWSRCVSPPLGNAHFIERSATPGQSAPPPQPNRLDVHRHQRGDLRVAIPHRC